MGHPKWDLGRADVPPTRNTGLGGADGDMAHDETQRRLEQQAAAAIVQAPAAAQGSSGGASPAVVTPKTTPLPTPGPDRRHKSSGATVYLMKDHLNPEGESPTNGGYRSASATASTIADGYQKAIAIKAMLVSTARVSIEIEGGLWKEDMVFSTDGIDLYGLGNVTIDGTWTILPPISAITIDNFTWINSSGNVPIQIMTGLDLPTNLYLESPIVLSRLRVTARLQCLIARRRFTAIDCVFLKTTPSLAVLNPPEVASVEIYMGPGDYRFTTFDGCEFYANPAPFIGSLEYYPGYAIKATSKISDPAGPQGGYFAAIGPFAKTIFANTVMLANSGVLLRDCSVYGSLLCEGWVVKHVGCDTYGGVILDTRAGGVYAITRGWAMDDGLTFQPAYVLFDGGSTVHAASVAKGRADAAQGGGAWKCGGVVVFRNSEHLGYYDGAYAAAMSAPDGSASWIYPVDSSTPSIAWRTTPVLGTDSNSPVGVSTFAMADPLLP